MTDPAAEFVLYRWWDEKGNLLYVGQSISVWNRVSQHRAGSEFFPQAAAMTLERLPSLGALDAAERDAIQREHPVYNKVHNANPGRVSERLVRDPLETVLTYCWRPMKGHLSDVLTRGDYVRVSDETGLVMAQGLLDDIPENLQHEDMGEIASELGIDVRDIDLTIVPPRWILSIVGEDFEASPPRSTWFDIETYDGWTVERWTTSCETRAVREARAEIHARALTNYFAHGIGRP